MCRLVRRILAGLTLVLLAAAGARGQAWLPPKGEASISFGYGNLYGRDHWEMNPGPGVPSTVYAGSMRTQSLGLLVSYGITDRFALTASIPFVTSRYIGPYPHEDDGTDDGVPSGNLVPADDGRYHGYLTDYRINLGYQALSGTVAVAPFLTVVIPSHDYPTLAHTAPGKGLNQVLLGFAAGASLDRIVPRTFVEVYYDYAFVEEVLGIHPNRSDFGFQMGYSVTPSLALTFLAAGFYTHNGLPYWDNLTPEQLLVHDQILRTSNASVGGALFYELTGNTQVGISYLRSIYGRGMWKLDHGLSFSVTYNFSPEQILRGLLPPKPDHAPGPFDK
jgi:hypothetical protein